MTLERHAAVTCIAFFAALLPAHAQDSWPTRAVRIVNSLAAVKSARQSPKGRLRMIMPALFGRLTFLANAAEFSARYPDIVLDLGFEDRPVDLIERGVFFPEVEDSPALVQHHRPSICTYGLEPRGA